MIRHRAYRKALEASGVLPILGNFIKEPVECPRCRNGLLCSSCGPIPHRPVEKQGDVNTAIHLIADAYRTDFDHFYLVTADSDQVATVKLFRELFPNKSVFVVAPPGQRHSQDILTYANGDLTILRPVIEANLLGPNVHKGGKLVVERPKAYDPPGSGKAGTR